MEMVHDTVYLDASGRREGEDKQTIPELRVRLEELTALIDKEQQCAAKAQQLFDEGPPDNLDDAGRTSYRKYTQHMLQSHSATILAYLHEKMYVERRISELGGGLPAAVGS